MAYKKYKVNYKYNFKTYLSFIKKYKLISAAIVLLLLLAELSSLVDKFLFKIVVDNGTNYVNDQLTRQAFVKLLLLVLFVYIIYVVVRAAIGWANLTLINLLEGKLMRDLKKKFFDHIIGLSYKFHTTHKTGSLISRLSRGTGAIERLSDFLYFNLVPFIFQTFIVSASLIYFDWAIAIIVMFVAMTFIGYAFIMQKVTSKANVKVNRMDDIEKGNLSDFFTNIESIKYFGKEKTIKEKYEFIINRTRSALTKYWNHFRFSDAGQMMILASGTLALMIVSIFRLLDHKITIGTLVFIYTVYGSFIGYLGSFSGGIRGYYSAMADFEPLFRYGRVKNDIKDRPNAKKLEVKEKTIEFRNVSFKYNQRYIFKNLNLKVMPNEKVALVGHSGSGKTTIVRLLYRLYDIDSGKILIDGHDIKNFKQESLRSELSIVPQECVLFDDTIYNNVLFSNPEASRKQVMEALHFSQLDKIISTFPKKENTIVGERGIKLSGGEKQRVSLARALLADKKIIVLDEATSSLDSQTEHEIKKDLEELLKNRTSIIIAHRLSTIMTADRIVVFDKGNIVQVGSHNELINQQGVYKRLWDLQKGGYIN